MSQRLIKKFIISGLHYYQDLKIDFNDNFKIIVGENGLGKTTMLKTLYFLLDERWFFLSNVGFDFIELHLDTGVIEFSQSELDAYISYKYKLPINYTSTNSTIEKFVNIEHQLKVFKNKIVFFPSYRNVQADTLNLGMPFKYYRQKDVSYFESIEAQQIIHDTLFSATLDNVFDSLEMVRDKKKIEEFRRVCNSYLVSTELVLKNNTKLIIENKSNRDVVKSYQLSTGEKQILFIFSKILLNNFDDLYILFDEPELSLSIKWQKRLLVDIVNSKKCKFLLAVTHSPFTFKNDLDKYAIGMNMYLKGE